MPAEPAEERNDIMKEQLEAIRAAAKKALSDCADSKVLETLRVQYLGKKGELTGILKQMGKLSAEERPAMGQLANQVRADIETALADKQKKLAEAMLAHKLEAETLFFFYSCVSDELQTNNGFYSTVTLFARLRGLSTSLPRLTAM